MLSVCLKFISLFFRLFGEREVEYEVSEGGSIFVKYCWVLWEREIIIGEEKYGGSCFMRSYEIMYSNMVYCL